LKDVGTRAGLTFDFETELIGGACLDAVDLPLQNSTIEKCRESDAVFLGAVGGPRWDNFPDNKRPEKGLLGIRKGLGLFTNLRPVKVFKSLTSASSLRQEIVEGIDLLVVRELTGGIYFGQPRSIHWVDGEERAVDSMVYSASEIERIARAAFKAAENRKGKVTSVDKANILATSQLWRKTLNSLAAEYPDIELQHMLVDNCAMQLIRDPHQFDVIVTTNMFGDIISDAASMLTGSLGMLPSASLGAGTGLYEPVHGSAPDIAGQDKANPLASICSVAMMFRHTFENEPAAAAIEKAVDQVLTNGFRTGDIHSASDKLVGTCEMGDLILKQIDY